MRNCFEMYAGKSFELAPQHSGREEDVFFSSASIGPQPEGGLEESDSSSAGDGREASASGISTDDDSTAEDDQQEEDFDSMQSEWSKGGWLRVNPIRVPTEREHYVMQQGLPVYRVLLRRVAD